MKDFRKEFLYIVLKNQSVLIPVLSSLQKNGLLNREKAGILLLQYEQIKVNFNTLMTGYEHNCLGVSPSHAASYGNASSMYLHRTSLYRHHRSATWGCPARAGGHGKVHGRRARNYQHKKAGKQGNGGKSSRGRKKLSKSEEQLLLARLMAVIAIIEFLMGLCSEIRNNGSLEAQQETAVHQNEAIGELSDAIEELNKTIREMNEKK